MSQSFSAVALFCEDIREEKAGTITLVGIFPDNINVSKVPMHFAKLAVFTRINYPVDMKPERLEVILKDAEGSETNFGSFDQAFIEEAVKRAKEKGAPIVGLITQIVAPGFPVQKPGRLVVVVKAPKSEVIAGHADIKELPQAATDSNVSVQPS